MLNRISIITFSEFEVDFQNYVGQVIITIISKRIYPEMELINTCEERERERAHVGEGRVGRVRR